LFDEPGCEFCALWDAEVGLVCTKTPEGQFAPLRRFLRGTGPFASLHGVVYTPTFVVVRGSNELGRITGYPGEDFFGQCSVTFWPRPDLGSSQPTLSNCLHQADGIAAAHLLLNVRATSSVVVCLHVASTSRRFWAKTIV